MEKTFNSYEYIEDLGKDLVTDFTRAGKTTHPGSVGSGREKAVKNRLKNILPRGVGIGSGFVIDSFGNTSAQCDIILYEEDIALKFIINEDESYAYYNCESVIAVGEIKSDATIKDIKDAFKKLKQIKELKRYKDRNSTRSYLSKISMCQTDESKFDPMHNEYDQIFTFILCKNLNTTLISVAESLKEIIGEKYKYCNYIYSIDGKAISFANREGKFTQGAITGDVIAELEGNFASFVERLILQIDYGRSVPLNTRRYIQNKATFVVHKIISLQG